MLVKTRSNDDFPIESLKGDGPEPPGVLIFWGNPIAFFDWILRIAAEESGNLQVLRIDSRKTADILDLCATRDVRLIVCDTSMAPDFLARFDELKHVTGTVQWVFAYRDTAIARDLLARRQHCPALHSAIVLPMSVPIDVWTPLFKLALSGTFFVPGDLLEDAPGIPHSPPPQPAASRAARPDPGLTPRERQVLALVAQGRRNKTVAYELGLSEHTVKLHLHHAITKIGVRNRTAAASWYLSQGKTT